jgi:hypothetical protein
VLAPVAFARWGGRPATTASIAETIRETLNRLPMPTTPTDDGWAELHTSTPLPDRSEDLIRLVEQHKERDSEGAVEPLAGHVLTFARGAGAHSADDSLPYLSVSVRAGVSTSSARLAANQVTVSASTGWMTATPRDELMELLRTLVQVWRPSWAVLVDEQLMLGMRRLPARTPWPGYATYYARSLVPAVVLPDLFEVAPFAAGNLAVLTAPWTPTRAIEGIEFFLRESPNERIPDREPPD